MHSGGLTDAQCPEPLALWDAMKGRAWAWAQTPAPLLAAAPTPTVDVRVGEDLAPKKPKKPSLCHPHSRIRESSARPCGLGAQATEPL